ITGLEDREISAMDYPTGFNYAAKNFGMISFDPEYVPGQVAEAYSSEDMTYALEWFGNLIIRFCTIPSKSKELTNLDPFVITKSWYANSYGTSIKVPTGGYAELPAFAGSTPIN